MPEEAITQLALPGLSLGSERRAPDNRRTGQGKPVPSTPTATSDARQPRTEPYVDGEARHADRIADRVASQLGDQPDRSSGQLIDAAEVARILGCARGWVYEHKAELGVVRLGGGERPRLRFNRERVRAFGAAPPSSPPAPQRKRRRHLRRRAPLLEIKGQAP